MMGESTVKPLREFAWSDPAVAPASDGRAEWADDWALVQQCAAGDEAACTRLVTDHQRMVYQLALHLLGDAQEALDAPCRCTDARRGAHHATRRRRRSACPRSSTHRRKRST